MIAKDKYEIKEVIAHLTDSIIVKATNTENGSTVMVKSLHTELQDYSNLSKMKNEYQLLTDLKSEYVPTVSELAMIDNRLSMVLEEEGILLSEYIKNHQLTVQELLYLAIKIVQCIKYLHKNQVVHKNINPEAMIYNAAANRVKLIGLGLSSAFSFETTEALHPNKLEGRLAYISPEQTGRMNRPIDYRTDFYSLGITLYELACSTLPFIASDPTDVVYYHIVKVPTAVNDVNPSIPKALSAIIAKLLEKMPEDRYKSAAGIIFDLEKCLLQYKQKQSIEEFTLGQGDIAEKFEIPKKIYGREQELKKLLTSFQNVSKGTVESVLISGYSGIGKTSLVKELHKTVVNEQGIFLSGKYDQYNRNTPYSAYFQVIDQFCQYVLSEPTRVIEYWKTRITEALGTNGRVIAKAVPLLELIIGEQPVLTQRSTLEEQNLFKIALKNWILAISSIQHPVIIFIDDMQWVDMASLELFVSILTDSEIQGLLFIGAYRDNEVDAAHPLSRSLEKVKKNNGKIQYIHLGNLDVEAISQLLADIAGGRN